MAVYLIGEPTADFEGRDLRSGLFQVPNKKQVLKVFFYYRNVLKKSVRESAGSCIRNLYEIWSRDAPDVVLRDHLKSVINLEKLVGQFKTLEKSKHRKTKAQALNEKSFIQSLQSPFDIAKCAPIVPRNKNVQAQSSETECFSSNSSSSDNSSGSASDSSDSDESYEPAVKKRAVLTKNLAAALDRALISDRKATAVVLSAVTPLQSSLGNINLTISRSSLQRLRVSSRATIATKIKATFNPPPGCTVHWDGKKLRDYCGQEVFDRLAIMISSKDITKLLSAPALSHGTGLAQATAVYSNIIEWNLTEKVVAMCSDTEAANTGKVNGAARQLELLMGRDLLYFPCRHHILEILLESVVLKTLGKFSSPEVPLFKEFRDCWKNINKSNFIVGTADSSVKKSLSGKDKTIGFLLKQIQEFQPRDDYRELAELLLLFAGEVPADAVKFRRPGAISRARWMMYAIYALKIFLFRGQFPLTTDQKNAIRQICVYSFKIHAEHWFTAPAATMAPRMDLLLLRNLKRIVQQRSKFSGVAKAALLKIENHLWYLSEHLVGLAFFDPEVPAEEKQKMVAALGNPSSEKNKRRRSADTVSRDSTLSDFVSEKSLFLFDQYGIDRTFLRKQPCGWEEDEAYIKGKEICKYLTVVNDVAERGVNLVKTYINTVCKSEEGFQNLLQVVELHQKLCPSVTKHEVKEVPLLLFIL